MDNLLVGTRIKGITYELDFNTHDSNELVLLHGGNCRFLVGNQFYYLQPGNLLMLDGNVVHKAYVFGDPLAYERSVLKFKTEWIQPLLQELHVEEVLNLFNESKNGLIRHFPKKGEAIIEGMFRDIENLWVEEGRNLSSIEEAKIKMMVAQLLIYMYESKSTRVHKEDTQRDEKTKMVEKISNYLFSNFHHSITIDDVAHEVGLTKSYMSHLFKDITGNTVMNYLMNYRLSQARNYLIERPNEPIREISVDCGFKSEAHFSRFFKKNIGVTPSEYRKNIIEQGESENGR
ncbi:MULTISPECIES: AraC family transcriptional regulator [unclassified Jeotgalibaca]|uniref:AraC family transcriptional regulator n=1 Tax=unclassified Jeotgalibaca TaxID=2621505 RepID=UPI003FD2778D